MNNSIAVIAAHPDDEVLGCGGTVSKMAQDGYSVHILLMADGESSRCSDIGREVDAETLDKRKSAAQTACEILGCASVELLSLPDNRLDSLVLLDVVRYIEDFLRRYQPCLVLTHHAGDLNVDHQVVHNATVVACRPQPGQSVEELLFFEVSSSTEWRPPTSDEIFAPNWFVDISETLKIKEKALQAYKSELREFPHPRSIKGVTTLAHYRGISVGVNAAEAFVLGRKLVK